MDLATTNNQTFVWTVSVAAWASLFNLSTAHFRMEIRRSATDRTIILDFDSSPATAAKGTIVFDPVSHLLTMRAPFAAVRTVGAASYVYGLVATIPLPSLSDPFVKLFAAGAIVFEGAVP